MKQMIQRNVFIIRMAVVILISNLLLGQSAYSAEPKPLASLFGAGSSQKAGAVFQSPDGKEIAYKKWFLPVVDILEPNEDGSEPDLDQIDDSELGLVELVQKYFGITLKKGIYYQNQWNARKDPLLFNATLDKEVVIDLSFLMEDSFIWDQLYDHGWLGSNADGELQAKLGFIYRQVNEGGQLKRMRELWLVKANYEMWKLHQCQMVGASKCIDEKTTRVMSVPHYFLVNQRGVVAFAEDWVLYQRTFGSAKGKRTFSYIDVQGKERGKVKVSDSDTGEITTEDGLYITVGKRIRLVPVPEEPDEELTDDMSGDDSGGGDDTEGEDPADDSGATGSEDNQDDSGAVDPSDDNQDDPADDSGAADDNDNQQDDQGMDDTDDSGDTTGDDSGNAEVEQEPEFVETWVPYLVNYPRDPNNPNSTDKIIFAGWVNNEAPDEFDNEISLEGASRPYNLYMMDLGNKDDRTIRIHEILRGLRGPLRITEAGIFYQRNPKKPNELWFRKINESQQNGMVVGKAVLIDAFEEGDEDREFVYEEDFVYLYEVTKNDVENFYRYDSSGKRHLFDPSAAVDDGFYPVDRAYLKEVLEPMGIVEILSEIQNGTLNPRYFNLKLNERLAQILDRSNKTWAVMVYEDGEDAGDLINSFVWAVFNGSVDASKGLRDLEQVFQLDHNFFQGQSGDNATEASTDDELVAIREAISETKTLLILKDFPTPDEYAASSAANQKRLQLVTKTFGDCTKSGKCRIILAIKKKVFDKVAGARGANKGLFTGISEVIDPIPLLDRVDEIPYFAQIIKSEYERIHQLPMVPEAFNKSLNLFYRWQDHELKLKKEKKPNNYRRFPGFMQDQYATLFSEVERQVNRDGGIQEVTTSLVTRFANQSRDALASKARINYSGMRNFLRTYIPSRIHREIVDDIINTLEGSRARAKNQAPPTFILSGGSGIGKTLTADLIAGYILKDGKEDEIYSISQDPREGVIKFDFKAGCEGGSAYSIDPKGPTAERIKRLQNEGRPQVVIFDDIHCASGQALYEIASVFETGVYKRGTNDEINFNGVLAIIATATWGHDLVGRGLKRDRQKIRQAIEEQIVGKSSPNQTGSGGKKVDPSVWSRIKQKVIPVPNMLPWELAAVAFARGEWQANVYYHDTDFGRKQVLFHPSVYQYVFESLLIYNANDELSLDSDTQVAQLAGQGRAMRDLMAEAFNPIATRLDREGVTQIVVTRKNNQFLVRSNGDEGFAKDWQEARNQFRMYKSQGIKPFLGTYFSEIAAQMQKHQEATR